eukprot:jgi/Tetstr1/448977/TSEL_036202.t1
MTTLTSRSWAMMAELRRLWYLLDSQGIRLRACYIRSAANVWEDHLSRHLDSDDWQLDPMLFAEVGARFGTHTKDMFASALNAMLPRYNAGWLDPTCGIKRLPRWLATEELVVEPRAGLFSPGGAVWSAVLTCPSLCSAFLAGLDAVTMAQYVTYLGNLGTIKATSLQPYMSAINGFFQDHGMAAMAVGPLISKAFASGRLPAARWAVEHIEKYAAWTADTPTR